MILWPSRKHTICLQPTHFCLFDLLGGWSIPFHALKPGLLVVLKHSRLVTKNDYFKKMGIIFSWFEEAKAHLCSNLLLVLRKDFFGTSSVLISLNVTHWSKFLKDGVTQIVIFDSSRIFTDFPDYYDRQSMICRQGVTNFIEGFNGFWKLVTSATRFIVSFFWKSLNHRITWTLDKTLPLRSQRNLQGVSDALTQSLSKMWKLTKIDITHFQNILKKTVSIWQPNESSYFKPGLKEYHRSTCRPTKSVVLLIVLFNLQTWYILNGWKYDLKQV